jgi:hypothetical protein
MLSLVVVCGGALAVMTARRQVGYRTVGSRTVGWMIEEDGMSYRERGKPDEEEEGKARKK